MSNIVVGVGDCAWSSDPESVLITYALGSCIGLAAYDPVAKVGGLLHYMLPDSKIDPGKATGNPFMFADTGIPLLLNRLVEMGAVKRRLLLWAAGGAQVIDDNGVFNIGKRNHQALRRILWQAGLMLKSEQTGGTVSRTVKLEIGSGRFLCRCPNENGQPVETGPAVAGGVSAWRTVY